MGESLGHVGDFSPMIGPTAPPLQCNRIVDGDLTGSGYCGRPATWHIIWTADLENGLACDEHAAEARRQWVYFGFHPYEVVCSMPDARYYHDIDRCLLDGEPANLEDRKAALEGSLTPVLTVVGTGVSSPQTERNVMNLRMC